VNAAIDLSLWGAGFEVVAPLTGGTRNASWKIRVGGRLAAARLSRRSPAALDWELDLMAAARDVGVRSAAVVATVDGRRHANGVVVFEWIDGTPPASMSDWHAARAALHQLHRTFRDCPQRPGFASTRDLLTRATGGDVDLSMIPAGVVEECRAAWRSVEDREVSAIHGDPTSNVLMVGRAPTFIDWDESRVDYSFLDFGLPHLDLLDSSEQAALVAWEVACSWQLEPAYALRRLRELRSM
jgi:Ser/Thr protein kinase RdoA (MazF antagonist)